MAAFGGADKDPQAPRLAKDVSDLLVDLEGVGGFFSGKVLDYRMACTAAAERTCQIVGKLSVWNEFPLWINLQLRESPQPERQLRLERIYQKLDWLDRTDREKDQCQATTVLFWLPKTHRCVARICIPFEVYDRCFPIFREAFYGNSSLKSLTLEASLNSKLSNVIASMKGLEELKCSGTRNACPRSISALLQPTQTLTVLKFSETYGIENSLSQRFLAALKANKTLRVLSINSDAIAGDPDLFAEIMGDSNTLQDVTVISEHSSRPSDMKWVLRGMLTNESILSLRVNNFVLDSGSVQLAARMFTENKVLRRFELSPRTFKITFSVPLLGFLSVIDNLEIPANTIIWQNAISRNSALEHLTLSVTIWSAQHWEKFFPALSKHASLKLVTVVVKHKQYRLLSPLVNALERSGSTDKVFLKAAREADKVKFPFGHLSPALEAFLCMGMNCPLPVSEQLANFSFLKELSFTICFWNNDTCVPVLEYIARTSLLRKLDIEVQLLYPAPEAQVWWRELSMSLRLNRSIVELGVGACSDGGDNVRHVGEAMSRSSTVRKFHLLSFDKIELAAFLHGLRADIFDNYALCNAVFENKPILINLAAYWLEVSDTA